MVAIKVLDLDTFEDDIQDVQKEIMLLSQLSHTDVQNVTRYHTSFLQGSKLWIIMDYCAGGSIRTLLKAGTIEEKYSAIIIREVLIALIYIHKEGIIHRDIKAANILVTREGRVQLCDFGVAAQLSTAQLRRTSMIGTPYWMAPEVIQEGIGYNQKADIWSLGVTLYEITTGHPPYAEQDIKRAMHLIPRQKPARLEGTQYSSAVKEFVAKCLDEKPEERATAEELFKAKFIKNTKNVPTEIIKDLILRYQKWQAIHGSRRNSILDPELKAAVIDFDEEDANTEIGSWDFKDDYDQDANNSLKTPPKVSNSNFPSFVLNSPGSGVNSPVPSQPGTITVRGTETNIDSTLQQGTNQVTFKQNYSVSPTIQLSSTSESHPLMELFETEKPPKIQECTTSIISPIPNNAHLIARSDMLLPSPMPSFLSNNNNSLSSNSNIFNPNNSLKNLPPSLASSTGTSPLENKSAFSSPVSIEIPSLENIYPSSGLTSSKTPLSSETPSIESQSHKLRKTLVSSVTPHTPIKQVFSQTNISSGILAGSKRPVPNARLLGRPRSSTATVDHPNIASGTALKTSASELDFLSLNFHHRHRSGSSPLAQRPLVSLTAGPPAFMGPENIVILDQPNSTLLTDQKPIHVQTLLKPHAASHTPQRFPHMSPLNSNILLDETSKQNTIYELDRLLVVFIDELEILEQNFATNYLSL